ncbi:MAG: DUF4149 domain-containing protein [Nitrospira sp.]|nr:DUF4149 domain-containing protein [Nitrospira sp.]
MMIVLAWLHILSAVTWIGGSLFLSAVLVPVLKDEPFAAQRGTLFKAIAGRFRMMVWASVGLLFATGVPLLSRRVDSLLAPSGWPAVLKAKLVLVIVLIGMTALHDFWIGPKVGRWMRASQESRTPFESGMIRLAPWVARLGLGLALAVLLLAAALVRL